MKPRNRRLTTLWFVGGAALFLLAVTVAGLLLEERAMETDFSRQNLAPSLAAPFGTDWMGRDMLARTLAGLSLSIRIGLLTAAVSAGVALALGILSAVFGGWVDAFISWWIDLVMGIPHILLVILLSIACGRGFTGEVGEGCPFLGQCPHPGADCAQGPFPLRPFQGGAVRCLYPNKEVAP